MEQPLTTKVETSPADGKPMRVLDTGAHSTRTRRREQGQMMMRAKAPLRIGFAGGGTDVPAFVEQEGGCVLNASINLYAFGTLCPAAEPSIQLRSADLNLALEFAQASALAYDGQLDLAKAAIRRLGASNGFDMYLHSDAPPGSGLGSSSSLMVTVIGLLKEWRQLSLSDYEVAELAYRLERLELGIPGGLQDQYAAAFGGWNFIEFAPDGVLVNPLRLPRDVVNELEHNLVLCFTGQSRASTGVVADQNERILQRNAINLESLRRQKQLAVEMKSLLLSRRLNEFGALLHEAWEYKKRTSPLISSPRLDAIYASARRAGALGGKLNGAGGGGYMVFYCDFERRLDVIGAVRELGCAVREFAFEPSGLQTWRAVWGHRAGAGRQTPPDAPQPAAA